VSEFWRIVGFWHVEDMIIVNKFVEKRKIKPPGKSENKRANRLGTGFDKQDQ